MVPLQMRFQEGSADFPFTLNTGRIRDQWHTMTRTGRVPRLMTHVAAPALALHPADAAARGVTDGALVKVESAQGSTVIRACLDAGLRLGEAFLPMHWTDQFSSSGPAGRLVHGLTDPISGQPDLKGTRVKVAALSESWRGVLLRLDGAEPEIGNKVWWAKSPLTAGVAFQLTGWRALAEEIDSEPVLRRLLGISADAELISYSDTRQGTFRYAGITHGRLTGCAYFAAPGAALPHSDQARALLGREITAMQRIALLAGLTDSGAKENGRIVCSCFSVSEAAIRAAMRKDGLTTPAGIGAVLKAGTNCGSCIPELKKLLALEPRQLEESR
jgi:assimilatory nitrate reductase catalytic subunit